MVSVLHLALKWWLTPPIQHQTGAGPRVCNSRRREALLEYASVGRTDNDRKSAQLGSAGQTEAIELGDRGRLQYPPTLHAFLNLTLYPVIPSSNPTLKLVMPSDIFVIEN